MNKSGIVVLACLIFAAAVAAKPAEGKPESGIVGSDLVTNVVQHHVGKVLLGRYPEKGQV